jgi:hypothetical protein
VIIAICHVLGSIVAVIAFGFAIGLLAAWEQQRNRKIALQEASISLGIPLDRLDDPGNSDRVFKFAADRFSSELLRNRLSDLCGLANTTWGWLGTALQVVILGTVIWYSFSDPSVAVNSWWLVAIAVFFWLVSVAFALLCKLLTGRFPGQARLARKQLAQAVVSRREM